MSIKISNKDWQYLFPFFVCTFCFLLTDFFEIIDKPSIAYWSGRLLFEPYRAVTFHFFHGDINHLLANLSGIIIARYFFKSLGLKNNYLFTVLILFLIPIQSILCWWVDVFVFRNPMSLAIGFSGVLYGVNAFILLSTIYGKKRFLLFDCELKKNEKLLNSISIITALGIVWSFIPGISLIGHLSGFLSGFILFLF
tara:strand:- start:19 stop:606 length:588 start_codon:yes stop_codon:yes gene_type:complete